MRAEQITGKRVIASSSGNEVGKVTGLAVDPEQKKVAALVVADRRFGPGRYIPYNEVLSIEHEVVMIPTPESLLDRRNLPAREIIESVTGKRVLTENGQELGVVQSYDVNIETGMVQMITFGVSKSVLGGLWKSTAETYEVDRTHVLTIGNVVVVDNAVPDIVRLRRAA